MSNLEVGVRLTADGRGLVGEVGRAREAIGGLGGEQRKASADSAAYTAQVERQNTSLGNLKGTILAAAGAYISFNAAVAGGRAVIDAALAQERLNNTLKVGLGSQQAATQEIAFLREEADRLGLQFTTTAAQYAKLAAASAGTVLQGQKTRDIFLAVAKASTVLGLSADDTGGVLTAFQQIISKGKVSTEELLQVAERVPGTFATVARAMDVTGQELSEMLQKGELMASDLLPRLAAEYERTYGAQAQEAAQGLNGQINRLDNTLHDLKLTVADTGLINLFSDGVIAATQFIGMVDQVIQKLRSIPGVSTVTSAAFGGGILPLIFGKDANAATAEIKQATAALEQAEQVISKITRPGSKPEPPKEFMAALKREAAERKKIADQTIREAQRKADADAKAAQQAVDASTRIIESLRRETQEIGLNAVQKRMLAAASEAAKAPTKELAAEIMASAQAWAMATQAQDEAIANNRQMQEAATARQRAETQAAQAVQQEWNQTWSTVESTARISFTQFAAHGVGAMEAIGKSIQNGIIDLLYQLTLRKWVINIGATLGLSGGAGSALASDGTGGGIGSILNIASMGSGALNLLKTGFGATGLAGSAISGLGSLTGSSSLAAFGGGLAGDAIGGLAAGGFTSGAASAASMGASVASFAGPAIAVAAVDQIVRMLAGDKLIGGGVGKVLNFVPVLGPLINGLFGRGPLKQRETTLSGTIGAQGFIDGSLNTDFRAKGGLFRSNKNDFARVDAVTGEISTDNNKLLDFANQLSTVAKDVIGLINDTTTQVGGSLKQIGADLALSTEGLDNFSHSIELVSEKGKMLTDEQIAEEIGNISDKMARSLLPNLDEFAKRGETALQTVSRLGREFTVLAEGVSVIFGQSGQAAKDIVNRFSIGDRSEFIEAAGGVENLGQKINQFFGNLDDSDKLTILEDRLKTALDAVGVNFIPTMEQFNAAMRSGDLSMQQFIAGLDLQGLIKEVNDLKTALTPVAEVTEDAEKKELDLTKAREGAARAADKAARREAQQKEIDAQEAKKQRSIEFDIRAADERAAKEKELLKLRFDNERAALEETRKRSQEITSFIESLRRSAFDVSPLGFQESGNIIASAIKSVASGADFQSIMTERVQAAIRGSGNIDERLFSSFDELARARGEATSRINELAALGENQLTTEGATLAELEKQTALLQKTFDVLNRRIDAGAEFDKSLAGQSVSGQFLTSGGTARRAAIQAAQRQIFVLENDLEQDPRAMLQARLQLIRASATPESVYGGGQLTQDITDMIKQLQSVAIEQARMNGILKRVMGDGDALNVRTVS